MNGFPDQSVAKEKSMTRLFNTIFRAESLDMMFADSKVMQTLISGMPDVIERITGVN